MLKYMQFPSRQGGKCWDPATRQWRPCAGAGASSAATGGPRVDGGEGGGARCCQPPECCLQCNDLQSFFNCFLRNNETLWDGEFPSWSWSQILRRMARGLACSQWGIATENFGAAVTKNGQPIPCFTLEPHLNVTYSPATNEIFLTSAYLKPTNEECEPVGIFLVVQAGAPTSGGDRAFSLLASGMCENPLLITNVESFYSDCLSCTGARP